MPQEIYTNEIIVKFDLDNKTDEELYKLYKNVEEMKSLLSFVYFDL